MTKWEKVYKKNMDMVSREIDDELILMPIYKTNKDINEMYTLNETAKTMWKAINGKATIGKIRDELSNKFGKISKEVKEKDLEELVRDLKKIKEIDRKSVG